MLIYDQSKKIQVTLFEPPRQDRAGNLTRGNRISILLADTGGRSGVHGVAGGALPMPATNSSAVSHPCRL